MTPEDRAKAEKERMLMERRRIRMQLEKEAEATEKADWRKEASRELFDPEQKALFERRKQLAEDVGSGAAARRGAEAGLKAQMAAAGAGRGSAASRMRGMARAQEAGVRGAAAQGAGAAQQQFGMLGQAGQGRFGMMKSDKAGKLGFFQKSRGLDIAEKAAKQQADATRAANSGGKASGGQIFKEFKRKNGKIEGPGTETSDDIKAMLSDGEFVVNAKTVRGLGEAMGAKGKEDSRKKGAGFLYDLQTKYGDKKPVKKMLGGMQIAELGAHAAKSGLLGKKLKGAGSIASSAIDVKKGMDKKKSDLDTKEADVQQKAHKRETEHHTEYAKGGKVEITPKAKQIPKELEKASKMHKSQAERLKKMGFKDGGHINLGKGVKAKKKFREAIGYEADKIFDKKAEKDYKEGDTGYKNYKGEKSVTPVKMGLGGFLGKVARVGLKAGMGFVQGGPAGAAVGAGKGVMDEVQGDKQKSQEKKQIEAQAASDEAAKKAEAGKSLASSEVQLKEGGAVKKDHPHYKYLKDLDKFMARQFPKGKKVDLDPGRKADKAIRAKKGSIKPMKFQTGDLVEKEIKSPEGKLALQIQKFTKEQQGAYKAFLKKGMPDSIKKLGLADSEARKVWQKMALKKAQSLKHTGGDASHAEDIGETDRLKKEERLRKRKAGHRRFVKKIEDKEKALIKDTGDAGRAEQIGKKRIEKRKLAAKMADAHLGDAKGLEGRRHALAAQKKYYDRQDKIKEALEISKKRTDAIKKGEYDKKVAKSKAIGLSRSAKRKREDDLKKKAMEESKKISRDALIMKEESRRRKAAQDEAAADKLVEKGRRETKSIMAEPKEVKKDKGFFGDMSDSDKAGLVMGVGKGLLSARQQYLKEKQRRRENIAAGERAAAATRAASGRQLIAAPVSLRKGGRVSFKDVLKAKKKMGY
jgi:hypothetical protein